MAKKQTKKAGKKPAKTTAPKTSRPKRPAKQESMDIDDGQDPDLREVGEAFLDARLAKREADGALKKAREKVLEMMEAKGVPDFTVDGIKFVPVEKGVTLRTQQPRKPKKSKGDPLKLRDVLGLNDVEDEDDF